MTFEIGLLLFMILVALVLFSRERLPAEVIALGLVLALAVTGLLPVEQAFQGFGSDAVIMILGLLILSAALLRTGVVELASRSILRRTGKNARWLLIAIMVTSAVIGAFISNTASTAVFIPVVIGMARRAKVSTSKLLMPLAFASILSSSVTLVSTSTNIVVSSLMTRHGQPPMGMFELTPVGIPVMVAGLLYMYFIGRRLIPDRQGDPDQDGWEERNFLTEVVVLPESDWIGKTLQETGLGDELDLNVVRVVRDGNRYMLPRPNLPLNENDVLLVEGQREDILGIKTTAGVDIKADVRLSDPELESEDIHLVDAIILVRSPLIGRTLKGFRFRERYGLQVLAINRSGQTMRRKLSQTPLRLGDVLLLQGSRENIAALEYGRVVRILSSLEEKAPNLKHAPVAIGAFAGSILLTTFNLLTFPVAVMLGVLVVFVTRALTPEEAYREVEWKAIILIGSMLGLGTAMEHTGAAEYLAGLIGGLLNGVNPVWLLSAFFALTVILTQPMSNQAAAIVVTPVALQTAAQLGLNPRTFAMMMAVAASCSFLTPLEPSCLMVYGPGGYRFADFLKVGSLLTVIIFLLAILLVPLFWPL